MTDASTVTTILAAVLAGGASGAVIQGLADHFASRRRRRGASRLMRDIAFRQQVILRRAAENGRWWHASDVPPAIGSEDFMLVAGSLPGQQWSDVTMGIRLFDHLEAKRVARVNPNLGELKEAFDRLEAARESLALAEPKTNRWEYSTFWPTWPQVDLSRRLRR